MTSDGSSSRPSGKKGPNKAADVARKGPSTSDRPSQDVGQYLRDAYRDALDEGVPDDMMDLLRKLD